MARNKIRLFLSIAVFLIRVRQTPVPVLDIIMGVLWVRRAVLRQVVPRPLLMLDQTLPLTPAVLRVRVIVIRSIPVIQQNAGVQELIIDVMDRVPVITQQRQIIRLVLHRKVVLLLQPDAHPDVVLRIAIVLARQIVQPELAMLIVKHSIRELVHVIILLGRVPCAKLVRTVLALQA